MAGFAFVQVTEVADSVHGTTYRGSVECGTPDAVSRGDLREVPLVLSACPERGERPSPGVVELVDHLCQKQRWLDMLASDNRLVRVSSGSSAVMLHRDFILESIDIADDGTLSVSDRYVNAQPEHGRDQPTHMKMVAWRSPGPRGEVMFQLLTDYLHKGISPAAFGSSPGMGYRNSTAVPDRNVELRLTYCHQFGYLRNQLVWAIPLTPAAAWTHARRRRREAMARLTTTTPLPVEAIECGICLEALSDSDHQAPTLRCSHRFHGKCLRDWLRTEGMDRICPNCRDPLESPEVSALVKALSEESHFS